MSSFMDSVPVFEQRLTSVGVAAASIDKLKVSGVDTLAKLAYCCNYNPHMQSDQPLTDFMTLTISADGSALPAGELACLRRAFFEAHTYMLSELKNKVERKEEDGPRKVPQPERNARLDAQRARLIGMSLTGPLEPSHALIDNVAQQREDDILRYIDAETATSRESELRTGKVGKTNKSDVSSDLMVRQALTRRSLAFDQLEVFKFSFLEAWVDYLFVLISREAIPGYMRISLQQVLDADKEAFVLTGDLCRGGISLNAAGVYPAEVAFKQIRTDPLLTTLLQHLPAITAKAISNGKGDDSKRHKGDTSTGKGPKAGKSKGKGLKGSKGAKVERSGQMPKALIGLNNKTKDGEPLCYGFNLNGCQGADTGKKCTKGWHVCAKCLGAHSFNNCTSA